MSKVYLSTIKDIVVIEPKVIHDSRGYFLESFRHSGQSSQVKEGSLERIALST